MHSPLGIPKRGTGRSRGRPRGSRAKGPISTRGRGITSGSAALAAAELAGAQAGKSAALAAYPFLGGSLSSSETTGAITRRGRGRGRGKVSAVINQGKLLATSTSTLSTPQINVNTQQHPTDTNQGLGFYLQQE